MSWEILPDVAWKSAVTLGITLALLHLLRDRSAAQRAWVAHIGLFATLVLPLAVTLLPRWEVAAAPVAQLAAPVNAIFETPVMEDVAAPSLAALPAPAASAITDTAMAWMPDTATLIALGWSLPALLLLLAMLVAVTRLFALRTRASVMMEQSWLSALAQAQVRMNFKHGTALLVSSEIASPVSWGVLRPVILLNQSMVTNRGDAEAIIAHELAHVSRLDWAGLLLGRLATALFWFNPLVWMVARQAHQLREEAADDAVLRSDVDRIDYAALLVGAARHEARGFLLAANGVAPSAGSLKRRITRVLDEHQLRAPAYLGWMSACVLGAVLVALPLAAFSATAPEASAAPISVTAPVQVAQAPVPPVPPAPQAAPVAPVAPVRDWNTREGVQELAREIREREREKAQELAERDRERAQRAVERAREQIEREQAVTERVRAKVERAVRIEANAARQTVTIDVPGVFIQASPQGATIRAPGVNIQADANGVESMAGQRAGQRSGGNAGATAGKPSSDELIKMAVLGIDRDYRDEIANAGYGLSVDQLHQLRIHNVKGDWLRDLAREGYGGLSVRQITNFAIHNVKGDFVRRMVRETSSRPTPEQMVQLRIFNGRPPGDTDKNKDKAKNFD